MSKCDESTQATNDDATLCKIHGVKLLYWEDPFLQYFARHTTPKAPEINRGYFIRTQVFRAYIDFLIKLFEDDLQIINLGAGFDTLYFRLCNEARKFLRVVDCDLPYNSGRKVQAVMQKKPLFEIITNKATSEVTHTRWDLHAEPYHILGADLRSLSDVEAKLKASNVDFDKPTLFLSECVLVYMDAEQSASLLQYFSKNFNQACFLLYEQVNMEDRFGETMLRNLSDRGCSLPGISLCKSIASQNYRFTSTGWKKSFAWNINEVYRLFPRCAIRRIEKIEHLDECEVMQQLFDHYCFAVAATEGLLKEELFDLAAVTATIS